jgi:hypothetical protein
MNHLQVLMYDEVNLDRLTNRNDNIQRLTTNTL